MTMVGVGAGSCPQRRNTETQERQLELSLHNLSGSIYVLSKI